MPVATFAAGWGHSIQLPAVLEVENVESAELQCSLRLMIDVEIDRDVRPHELSDAVSPVVHEFLGRHLFRKIVGVYLAHQDEREFRAALIGNGCQLTSCAFHVNSVAPRKNNNVLSLAEIEGDFLARLGPDSESMLEVNPLGDGL